MVSQLSAISHGDAAAIEVHRVGHGKIARRNGDIGLDDDIAARIRHRTDVPMAAFVPVAVADEDGRSVGGEVVHGTPIRIGATAVAVDALHLPFVFGGRHKTGDVDA